MTAPSVTVLMPVYNADSYLKVAIESVLNQSFEDFELLVIDDGSTDESMEVLHGFRDERIRVEHQAENRGLIETLNRGIGMARGSLLARMDADDISHPERFAMQVDYLSSNPGVAGVSCAFDVVDDRGQPLPDDYGCARPVEPLALRWGLNFGCYFLHPGAILRTKVMLASGGFDPRYQHAEDYELWLRLSEQHCLANIPQILLSHRLHGANVSTRHREIQRENAYLALQSSMERLLKRDIVIEEVRHFRDGTLPESSAKSRTLAALHCEMFAILTSREAASQTRVVSGDLAQRLGVLASRSLRPYPVAAMSIAGSGLRHGVRDFILGFMRNRRGESSVLRHSPLFENAPLASGTGAGAIPG